MKNKPYALRVFMPDGDPEGMRIIEKSNWTGSGLQFPRSMLVEAGRRPELSRAGVYLLFGSIRDSGLPKIYIGEGDPILPRLETHARAKDFWTSCIVFTSKDEQLNKAHIQFLESSLLAMALDRKLCSLDNVNGSTMPSMSEIDRADAAGFLDEILLCCPLLGLNVFMQPPSQSQGIELLSLEAKGVTARGFVTTAGFVVKAGSQAVSEAVPSCQAYVQELRQDMQTNGALRVNGANWVFTQDYPFGSPSTAASVVLGRSVNGRDVWRNAAGIILKDLQES